MEYRPSRPPLVNRGGIEHHARDMTVTVSADVTLAQLQSELATHDQWLPIDGDMQASLGALVSTDSTGPLRLGYGAWRDLLLGVQFLNGRGELITAGGRTVKNVAGYDLTKFIVGQRGIFGHIVTVTSRTYRRPVGAILARHVPDVGIIGRLIPSSLRPQWAVLTAGALMCAYLGDDEASLAFYRSAIPRSEPTKFIERSLAEDVADRASLWHAVGDLVFRASVPPARLHEFTSSLKEQWAADAAFGVVVGTVSSENEIGAIQEAATAVGGTARFFRGASGTPLDLSTTAAEKRIIERLKIAFDPDNRLNPLPWRQS